MLTHNCPLCGCEARAPYNGTNGGRVVCTVCGDFFITEEAWDDHFTEYPLSKKEKAYISAWLHGKPRTKLDTELVETLKDLKPPSVISRLDNLLFTLSQESTSLEWVEIEDKYRPIVWAQDFKELRAYMVQLCQAGWIEAAPLGEVYRLKVDGWRRVDELSQLRGTGNQAFIAMSFSADLNNLHLNAMVPAITAAGYSPYRVDMSEHNGKIDDEIVAQIRRSRFIVADFTGHRGGVYYEAGFAQGLGLPVIWCCRKDDVENLHFDVRQYNCLLWNDGQLEDFQSRLQFRIESILGQGPLR
ncbi:MAG: hypothetical protein H7A06_04025 [Pseudomonadales bacterium]|nr:hypothetical protein [Pseudomonadales bacterium]